MELEDSCLLAAYSQGFHVTKPLGMGTIVVCAALLIFGVVITLYDEDGWMLLLVAIALAGAFIFVAVS
jgi:hypothetical protein